jgi:hypothetical protein
MNVAVMVAVPTATAVTVCPEMLATAGALEVKTLSALTLLEVPSA